jgi:glycosyltransferase involved in cell wall biosynthesis
MTKTRIVQVIPSLRVGGAERMLLHLVKHLDRLRHEVVVVSLYGTVHSDIERELASLGIQVVYLGKKPGLECRMWWRLDNALRRLRPDVVHTHLPVLHYAIPSAVGWLRGRVVHTVHTVAGQDSAGMPGRVAHWLAFRSGVAPVAICEFVAETIVRVYGVRPRAVIPNGVPVRTFMAAAPTRARSRAMLGIRGGEIVYATVARLAPPKDIRTLLAAFARLSKRGNVVLLLAGDGPLRTELVEEARARGLGRSVRFLGARSDVPEILAASDVFVLSSSWEGSPLSVMEAMAAGRPAVATSVGGVPELVEHGETGVLVPPSDVTALERAMSELAVDAELRGRLGRNAQRVAAERFDVSTMSARYARLYEEILGGPGIRARTHTDTVTRRGQQAGTES